MSCPIRNGRSGRNAVKALVVGVCCVVTVDAWGGGFEPLLADTRHDTPTVAQWGYSPDTSIETRHADRGGGGHGVETGFQLQWGRLNYTETLPAGIWNPSRALTSRADLDWGGSRFEVSGFVGSTPFRYGVAAQLQKSQQGLEQWWDGDLLYQKNQLEFQAVQLEGGLGWSWDFYRISGQLLVEAVGRQEDQRRSYSVGQAPFSVERIRSAWVGLKGDARIPLAEGIAMTAGGNWDYAPWSQMTNTIFASSSDSVFRSSGGTRWQAWVGFKASGRYALGPLNLAVVVGMSETRLGGDTSGRTVTDASGGAVTAYWPQNKHREYGVGMTLTWNSGQ